MTPRPDPDLTVLERPRLVREICADLDRPLHTDRAAALDHIEQGGAPSFEAGAEPLRAVSWNVERGAAPDALAGLLAGANADIALLSELDNGLTRTGDRHVARSIAGALGAAYVYAVEFVELDEAGQRGLHGNAIVARVPLRDPLLIRLAHDDSWMARPGRKRRLGGRMALAARVGFGGHEVVVAVTHLESHAGPDVRAGQMCALLDAIDGYAGDSPVLIGGDFNTRTASKDDMRDAPARASLERRAPRAFVAPEPYEPLFEVARGAGFDWSSANARAATERSGPADAGTSRFRLDWFFARGLDCRAARNIPAAGASGTPLSDHDAIAVDIRVPDRKS